MRITGKGQVTIPAALRKKHGLKPRAEIVVVDRPDGVLVAKLPRTPDGKRVVSALLRGGKLKGRTEQWLRLTRGES